MSDNLRRYRAIRDGLLQLYPTTLTKRQHRQSITLAALISGIVGSRHTHLPAIASKLPDRTQRESQVKRFQRWLTNANVTPDLHFLPFAQALLQRLAHVPLVLVIDGSTVGRGCVALVVSLVYQGRALPVAWLVVAGRKGHFAADTQIRLVQQVQALHSSRTRKVGAFTCTRAICGIRRGCCACWWRPVWPTCGSSTWACWCDGTTGCA